MRTEAGEVEPVHDRHDRPQDRAWTPTEDPERHAHAMPATGRAQRPDFRNVVQRQHVPCPARVAGLKAHVRSAEDQPVEERRLAAIDLAVRQDAGCPSPVEDLEDRGDRCSIVGHRLRGGLAVDGVGADHCGQAPDAVPCKQPDPQLEVDHVPEAIVEHPGFDDGIAADDDAREPREAAREQPLERLAGTEPGVGAEALASADPPGVVDGVHAEQQDTIRGRRDVQCREDRADGAGQHPVVVTDEHDVVAARRSDALVEIR